MTATTAPHPPTTPPAPTEGSADRPGIVACISLLLAVLLVILVGDARFNSGSDAGGKTATVDRIADLGLDGVDVGYWAESVDPDGRYHPMINTRRTNEGWIQVTSAVMPSASSAGRRFGGEVGALWLSMLAVPLGALAAARLSRRLGAPHGWVAFMVVGALSPLTFYGADQWEHGPALAAGLWATVLLLEHPTGRRALLAGLVAGTAVVLRREVVFVLLLVGLGELLVADGRRHWLQRSRSATLAVAGAGAVVLAAGTAFDRMVLGESLSGRSASQAALAGSDLSQRLSDGLLTTISQYPRIGFSEIVLGTVSLVGVAVATLGWRDDDASRVRLGSALAIGCVAIRIASGTGFVPGAFAVLPLTAAAPVLARGLGRRLIAVAVGAVVATIAFQWTGSLAAQWGGRYLLVPAAIVAVVAASEFERRDWRAPVALVALGATGALAVFGLAWHVERTDWMAARLTDLEAAVEVDDVVISTQAHFPREIGSMSLERGWLRANTTADVPGAFEVADAAGAERVRLLHSGLCEDDPCDQRWGSGEGARDLAGWSSTGTVPVAWFGEYDWVLETFVPT